MTRSNERELIAKAMAGCRDACAALWVAHRRWLAGVLLVHAPRGAEIEDLLQDVAMKMWTGIRKLDDGAKLRPWLRVIAINTARSTARKANVRDRTIVAFARQAARDDEASAPSPDDDAVATQDSLAHVLRLVEALPTDYREALVLKAIEGMSQREVAEVLGIPETTVETRLVRARRMLRELLGPHLPNTMRDARGARRRLRKA